MTKKATKLPITVRHYFRKSLMRIMPKSSIHADELTYQYLVLRHRLIRAKPRTILYSNRFVRPTNPDLLAGLEEIEDKIYKGGNINPYLSNTIEDINFFDGMLYDWGIYHFHMGHAKEGDKRSGRTGDLIYAYVTDNTVYFIIIAGHRQWENKELLDIIALNWSNLAAKFELEGKVLTPNWTETDIRKMRKGGINVTHNLACGKSLVPMGMGVTTNGKSIFAAIGVTDINRWLKQLERQAKSVAILDYKVFKAMGVPEDMLPTKYKYMFQRTSDECICIIQYVDDDSIGEILDCYEFMTPKKMIYG